MNYRLLTLLLFWLLLPVLVAGQVSMSAENTGLGGGGTAYITGYEALFINPANLQIRNKNYSIQVGFLQSGVYYESPLEIINPAERFDSYRSVVRYLNQPGELDLNLRNDLLDRNFGDNDLNKEFLTRGEILWFGIKWFREERSYAMAMRSRTASRYRIGRGYYDDTPMRLNGIERVDQSLTHRYNSLHELSFGYSSPFTYLNGLIPRLSEFIVGIAPKLVVSGSLMETEYLNRYEREIGSDTWARETMYDLKTTGAFSEQYKRVLSGIDPLLSAESAFADHNIFSPTGIGIGLDLGITYLITFGDDLSVVRREEEVTEKSLRLSFSLTDLGAIYYYDDPVHRSSGYQAEESDSPELSNSYFTGSPSEDLIFLNQMQQHPVFSSAIEKDDNFEALLPTAFNAGALFQINRLRMMGDFSVGLHRTAFVTPKFISFIGAEIRPLSFLPLRAGTRIATEIPGYYSFGAGIETTYFDLNAAIQLRSKSGGPTAEPIGTSVVAIKFYIP